MGSEGHRFVVRPVAESDRDGLFALAAHIDSVNLPHNREAIDKIITRSKRSFEDPSFEMRLREYVFVVHDQVEDKLVGSSLIVAQLGRPTVPYVYFDVLREDRYSDTLGRAFSHDRLLIGYSHTGPTEVGGLVVHPDYRRRSERVGTLISYARFLFIAMNRDYFHDRVLARLLPPLEQDGTSHLWNAIGKRFTGLRYREADHLSKRNKEFVRSLFPASPIYVSLLSESAQSVIGRVGDNTKGVEKILQRIGFRYANRVDPFDGGPHFIAPTEQISLIANAKQATVEEVSGDLGAVGSACLLACPHEDTTRVRIIRDMVCLKSDTAPVLRLSARAAASLGVRVGDSVWAMPIE